MSKPAMLDWSGIMPPENTANSKFLVPGAILLAGVIIAAAIAYTRPASRPQTASQIGLGGEKSSAVVSDLADDDPSLGNPEAAVTIVEFGDFQCPFCGRFFRETEPEIIVRYVKTGKARFVYRDFSFLGPESGWAAQAAECADKQGKFWQYHDYLYSNQQGENQGAFSRENLKRFAIQLGLDAKKFNSCLDSEEFLQEINKDTADGRAAGVSGTPTTFINGRPVVGALPLSEFERIIEEALAGSR